jgi:hypothetical protein
MKMKRSSRAFLALSALLLSSCAAVPLSSSNLEEATAPVAVAQIWFQTGQIIRVGPSQEFQSEAGEKYLLHFVRSFIDKEGRQNPDYFRVGRACKAGIYGGGNAYPSDFLGQIIALSALGIDPIV